MEKNNKRNEIDKSERRTFQSRFASGQLVEGIVVHHAPFGMFIDLGDPRFPALVELPEMESFPGSRPGTKEVARPAVGSRIKAVVVMPLHPERHQLRLLIRPTALQAAATLQQITHLPSEQRAEALRDALSSQEPDVPLSAVWHVRHLPLPERVTFLRLALAHRDNNVAAAAVWRVADLAEGEREAFLRYVVQHEPQGVAVIAVKMAKHLSMGERRLFLQEAVQHPFHEVSEQARFELERVSPNDPLDK